MIRLFLLYDIGFYETMLCVTDSTISTWIVNASLRSRQRVASRGRGRGHGRRDQEPPLAASRGTAAQQEKPGSNPLLK